MITAQVFETPPIERGKLFSYSEAFCEGGPNPREGSKSRGVQIRWDTGKKVERLTYNDWIGSAEAKRIWDTQCHDKHIDLTQSAESIEKPEESISAGPTEEPTDSEMATSEGE